MLRLGLVVNPFAGLGGSVALKGTDGLPIRRLAQTLGARSHVAERVSAALRMLLERRSELEVSTWGGSMGEVYCRDLGLPAKVAGCAASNETSGQDTQEAVRQLCSAGIDLLLFAGGDGTARDVCNALPPGQLCLGIPCGVKMHSGVFAVTPAAVGELLLQLLDGALVGSVVGEVRDLDEDAFRHGVLRARFHGEMRVPEQPRLIQQVKAANPGSERLAMEELADWIAQSLQPDVVYILGSGTTLGLVKERLGLQGTLLGIDVVRDGKLLIRDATERQLLELVDVETHLIVTAIGAQGHVFGRGNQQLSPAVLNRLKPANIHIVATRGKLESLEGRPLLLDTGDAKLDLELAGLVRVTVGYDEEVVYRLE